MAATKSKPPVANPGNSSGGISAQSVITNPHAEVLIITDRSASEEKKKFKIYNVTDLCMTASLQLVENGSSSFRFMLANPDNRVINLFQPTDKVIVTGGRTPDERIQMFTGSITKSPVLTYHKGDPVMIECQDRIHELNRIYIDPWMTDQLLPILNKLPDEILYYLLTSPEYGGMSPDDIFIADLPAVIRQRWLKAKARNNSTDENDQSADSSGYSSGSGDVIVGGPLNADQKIFCEAMAVTCGMSLRVIGAWVQAEGGSGNGDQNWLNIGGPAGAPTAMRSAKEWRQGPEVAGTYSGKWIMGKVGDEYDGYVASSSIQHIPDSRDGTDQEQLDAIVNSDWGTTSLIYETYKEIHVKHTNNSSNTSPESGSGTVSKGHRFGSFSATAYGPPWGGIQGTGTTATGVDLHDGKKVYGVAVDPDVIPLGTKLYIWPNPFNYEGAFRAFDTGGAIQGNRIDFYDWRGRASQYNWGRRDVEVWKAKKLTVSQKQADVVSDGGFLDFLSKVTDGKDSSGGDKDSTGSPEVVQNVSKRSLAEWVMKNVVILEYNGAEDDLLASGCDGRLIGLLYWLGKMGWQIKSYAIKTDHHGGTNHNPDYSTSSSVGEGRAIDINDVKPAGGSWQSLGSDAGQMSKTGLLFAKTLGSAPSILRPTEFICGSSTVLNQFMSKGGAPGGEAWGPDPDHHNHYHVGWNAPTMRQVPKFSVDGSVVSGASSGGSAVPISQATGGLDSDQQPWDQDEIFKYVDDQPLMNYVNAMVSAGMYKMVANGYGQIIINIPNYIDYHTYEISDYELMGLDPSPSDLNSLITHVYVEGSPSYLIPPDLETAWGGGLS